MKTPSRKILSVVLAVAVLASLLATSVFAGLCSFGNLGSISQRISTIRCSQRESCYCRTCIEVFYPRILSYVSYQYHSIY